MIKKYQTLLVFLFTILIMGLLIYENGFGKIVENLSEVPLFLILLSIILTIQMPFIQAIRLNVIFNSVDINISLRKLFFVIAGSYPLLSVTPSRSGDFVRIYYLRREVKISD